MHCACTTSFFIFDWSNLITHVSSGDGKDVLLLSFDRSLMWCEQFCPRRTFNFDDFYFGGKPDAKIQKHSWSHLNIANIRWHYICMSSTS